MTQEGLLRQICNWFSKDGYDNHKIKDVTERLAKFFESNICIPRGQSRHEYADLLHEWLEGNISIQVWDDQTYSSCFMTVKGVSPSTDKEGLLNKVLTNKLRRKPTEPVYEWQCLKNGKVQDLGFYTDEELKDATDFQKIQQERT